MMVPVRNEHLTFMAKFKYLLRSPSTRPQDSYEMQRKLPKPKMELPMILKGKTILATPDSGSEDNIISREVVTALGLHIEDAKEHQKEYRMGNNRIVKALGRVWIECTFFKG